jgi:DNA-binding transcriptional LysR family regulator
MQLLADLEMFVTVAELRNFGRAAAGLNITAPTLSRRIAGLERKLDLVLIRRSTRSFSLTEAGQQLLERSSRLIDEAKRMREELSSNFNTLRGQVRVGSPSDLTTTILAPAFAKFCLDNHHISLEIVSTRGQPDLERDKLDIAFGVTHQASLPDSLFSVRRLGSFSRMLYASRTYLKRHGTPGTPQALQEHSCLCYLDETVERNWRLHRDRKSITVSIGGRCASSSVIVSAQAAREHVGIAMLPSHLASHPTYGAGLTRVLPEWSGTPVNVFAVTADRKLPARLEELIRVTRSEFTKRLAELEIAGRRVEKKEH